MVKKNYSKSKIVITDKDRKKYGVCEHDQVSYKALDKMCKDLLLHCKRLSRDIDRKGRMMELFVNNRKLWAEKINEQLQRKADLHKQEMETLENAYKNKINELQDLYDEAVEVNTDVVQKNRDCIEKNREILKDHNEIVRAYNGLAEMGKVKHSYSLKKKNGKDH